MIILIAVSSYSFNRSKSCLNLDGKPDLLRNCSAIPKLSDESVVLDVKLPSLLNFPLDVLEKLDLFDLLPDLLDLSSLHELGVLLKRGEICSDSELFLPLKLLDFKGIDNDI